ncbi:hypothetical protein [Endozoicomonas arenosclerae]|uniref:hypothetical protein n=1 Tax=Endozoicomonas arenosclerae TaxID=1633495 RepID=UPI00129477BB|nr:hypothetical protein [Endozoicomonas arenosclerae]
MRSRIYLTLLVSVSIWALLSWQFFHDGIPRHYILHRSDMPAISNLWGAIFLPFLTWFLTGKVIQREAGVYSYTIAIGFFSAFLYGVTLSAAFVSGFNQVASFMGPGMLLLALFLPIYRAEYFLGFVLGMTWTFGAVLPTGFGTIITALSFLIYNFIRPVPFYLLRKLRALDNS